MYYISKCFFFNFATKFLCWKKHHFHINSNLILFFVWALALACGEVGLPPGVEAEFVRVEDNVLEEDLA